LLNYHQFLYILSFELCPTLVELLQDLFDNDPFLRKVEPKYKAFDFCVKHPKSLFDTIEALHQCLGPNQHLLGKIELLTIYPQIRKAFLRAVEYLRNVTETALLVQISVGLAEILTICPIDSLYVQFLRWLLNIPFLWFQLFSCIHGIVLAPRECQAIVCSLLA
jgi:hypothetical protein